MRRFDDVVRRLDSSAVLPETRTLLLQLFAEDSPEHACMPQWDLLIPTVYTVLGGTDPATLQPFATAWAILVAAIRRLDHVQDGDIPDHVLPLGSHVGAQYNLLFSYCLLAAALLDDLDRGAIPPDRLFRLRRLWADCLLRAASGQQLDLQPHQTVAQNVTALDRYQQIARAKSGAIFMLAFGGTAMLTTDDPATVEVLSLVGEVYGMLLQFNDDLLDAPTQPEQAVTLPNAYHRTCAAYAIQLPPHDIQLYWQYMYAAYFAHVERALQVLTPGIHAGIRHLFAMTFKHHPTGEGS